MVQDGRQDRFGSGRVWQRALDSISLGYRASGEEERPPRYVTVPLDSAASAARPLALFCWAAGHRICTFADDGPAWP
jgi:hypothetical protein